MKVGNGERGAGNVPMARVSAVRFVLLKNSRVTAIHMFSVLYSPFPITTP